MNRSHLIRKLVLATLATLATAVAAQSQVGAPASAPAPDCSGLTGAALTNCQTLGRGGSQAGVPGTSGNPSSRATDTGRGVGGDMSESSTTQSDTGRNVTPDTGSATSGNAESTNGSGPKGDGTAGSTNAGSSPSG